MVPSLPLLSCESSVSVKENPDRKKIYIFSSKTYVSPTKSRSNLARKLELFYQDIHLKRQEIANNEKMRLQTNWLGISTQNLKKWIKITTLKCLAVV